MASSRGLLVINHVMDDSDPFLSHQSEVVRLLASRFPVITVITGRVGQHSVPSNVRVICTDWVPGRRIGNALSFLRVALPVIFSSRHQVVFSHMADLQAALIAPFAKLTDKKHYLWYAHTHKSLYLSWASIWVNGIISSTQGSSPIHGKKVSLIGQSVNPNMFPQRVPGKVGMDRLIHVGRLDRSKNIHLLIDSTLEIRKVNPASTLTLVGSSANTESSSYFAELNRKYELEIKSGVVSFVPSMPRSLLPGVLSTYDVFIHGYLGSLDKTLVEATYSGMPVITLNPEYVAVFGTWSSTRNPDLYQEYAALHAKAPSEITEELNRRWGIANTSHSSTQWIQKLSEILQSGLNSTVESRTEGSK